MDFDLALRQLVEVHTQEVRRLRTQINHLNSVLRQSSVSVGGASLRSASTPITSSLSEGEHQLPFERHHCPLTTPKLNGVSCLGPITPPQLPERPLITPPTKRSTAALKFPEGRFTPQRQSGCGSWQLNGAMLRAPTEKKNSSMTDEVLTMDGSMSIRDMVGQSSLNSSALTLTEESVEGDEKVELNIIVIRWRDLTEGLANYRSDDFSLHPGWIQPNTPSHQMKSVRTTRSSWGPSDSPEKEVDCARMFGMSEGQKTALAKLEYKARCARSNAPSANRRSSVQVRGFSLFRRFRFSTISRASQQGSVFVSHPASPRRRVWIVLCLVVILYEIFAITMEPFEIFCDSTARVIDWISACFWATDIVVNFFSGIYLEGKVEMRLVVIAKHYIRSWFLFDLFVASSQFFSLLVKAEGSGATTILRLVRCVRSVRLGRVFYWLKDEFNLSSSVIAGGKLLQFLVALYFFVHCSACLWYEVGKAKDGWVSDYHGLTGNAGQNYLVSLHWSLAQLQGSTDLYPGTSVWDRIFIAVSSYMSIVVLTFFVSSMTDTLFSARQLMKRKLDETYMLTNFFNRHDIDPEIRARAEHYFHMKEKQQNAMEDYEQDQQTLHMFPAAMRSQLRAEVWAACLVWHPVFGYLHRYNRNVFCKVCSTVLEFHTYDPNDDVFTIGELSEQAFFIYEGDFVLNANFDLLKTMAPWLAQGQRQKTRPESKHVTLAPSSGSSGSKMEASFNYSKSTLESEQFRRPCRPVMRVGKGATVSEASLWVSWVHSGDLCAVEHGQCFSIGTNQLIAVVCNHPSSHAVFGSYAVRFLAAAKILRQDQSDKLMEMMTFQTVLEIEDLQLRQRPGMRWDDEYGSGDQSSRQSLASRISEWPRYFSGG